MIVIIVIAVDGTQSVTGPFMNMRRANAYAAEKFPITDGFETTVVHADEVEPGWVPERNYSQ